MPQQGLGGHELSGEAPTVLAITQMFADDGTVRLREAAGLIVGQPVNALGTCNNRTHPAKLTPRRSLRNPLQGNGQANRCAGYTGLPHVMFRRYGWSMVSNDRGPDETLLMAIADTGYDEADELAAEAVLTITALRPLGFPERDLGLDRGHPPARMAVSVPEVGAPSAGWFILLVMLEIRSTSCGRCRTVR
jgi:hypothetical protein